MTVEVQMKVMPKVIKTFGCRVRGVCGVPVVSTKRVFKVFNILLAEISSSACGVLSRDLCIGWRCEGNEMVTNVTNEYS